MYYYLGLGSNIGAKEQTISKALRLLDERVGKRLCVAPLMYSRPQGFSSRFIFCNTVAVYSSMMRPLEVLARTQAIERELGRTEYSVIQPDGTKTYSDREIDIDLIQVFDHDGREIHMNTPTLTLPHPRMHERAFVMEPLQQLHL